MTIAEKRKEYRLINILFKTIYKKKSAKWRGDYLREKHIFHHIGENVHLWGGGYRRIRTLYLSEIML